MFCRFLFNESTPAIVGIDLKPYGDIEQGFVAGEVAVIPVDNAVALENRNVGRIIELEV